MTSHSRVARAFEALQSQRPNPGQATVVVIGPDRNLSEARLALDHLGVIHLFVALPPGRETFALPLAEVLPAKWFAEEVDDAESSALDIACPDPKLIPTFLSLLGEMLTRVDESGDACIDELMRVLGGWREALAREQRASSRQRAIGLFGELTVLRQIARTDPTRAMAVWRGKEGYRHDFFHNNAVEVKAYTGTNSPSVEIHGVYQLDPPSGGDLHLIALRLEESSAGKTVADLIDELDALGVPRGFLFERSTDDSPIISEDTLRFVVAEERLFHVTEDFPGLRASRISAERLIGVSNLRFALMLDVCPSRLDAALFDQVLKAL